MAARIRRLTCSQCDCVLHPGERYYVILGDIYCSEHGEEWIQDEIAERFNRYKDELAELTGVIAAEV